MWRFGTKIVMGRVRKTVISMDNGVATDISEDREILVTLYHGEFII